MKEYPFFLLSQSSVFKKTIT